MKWVQFLLFFYLVFSTASCVKKIRVIEIDNIDLKYLEVEYDAVEEKSNIYLDSISVIFNGQKPRYDKKTKTLYYALVKTTNETLHYDETLKTYTGPYNGSPIVNLEDNIPWKDVKAIKGYKAKRKKLKIIINKLSVANIISDTTGRKPKKVSREEKSALVNEYDNLLDQFKSIITAANEKDIIIAKVFINSPRWPEINQFLEKYGRFKEALLNDNSTINREWVDSFKNSAPAIKESLTKMVLQINDPELLLQQDIKFKTGKFQATGRIPALDQFVQSIKDSAIARAEQYKLYLGIQGYSDTQMIPTNSKLARRLKKLSSNTGCVKSGSDSDYLNCLLSEQRAMFVLDYIIERINEDPELREKLIINNANVQIFGKGVTLPPGVDQSQCPTDQCELRRVVRLGKGSLKAEPSN